MSYEEIMRIDLELLSTADYLVQLPGWERSIGASRELGFALGTDKIIVSLEQLLTKDGDAVMTLDETYDFLMQIRRKEIIIRRKETQRDELRACLLPGAIRYDRDRRSRALRPIRWPTSSSEWTSWTERSSSSGVRRPPGHRDQRRH